MPKIELLTGSFNQKPGETIKLIAHTTEELAEVNIGKMVFKLNGITLKDSKNNPIKITTQLGMAILEYKIPDTLTARTHNLTAVYKSIENERNEITTEFTINKLNTHINTNPPYTNTDNITINAEILDDNNQKINKITPICIKIDGKSHNLNTTNGQINYKITEKLTKGLHQITIISGENGKYLPSRTNNVIIRI